MSKPTSARPTAAGAKAAGKSGAAGKGSAKPAETRIIASNKKAFFDLAVDYTVEAGIVLVGSEVKSIRGGKVVLTGAHVRVVGSEAFVFGLTIQTYEFAHQFGHEPDGPRKLLMNRREIDKLSRDAHQKGVTAVVTRIYFVGPRIKLEFAVGTGKKAHDKRDSIKTREATREMARAKR